MTSTKCETQEHGWRKEAETAFADFGYLIPVSPVAKTLGISRATVYRLAERGDLQCSRAGLTGESTSIPIVRSSAVELLAEWLAAGDEN